MQNTEMVISPAAASASEREEHMYVKKAAKVFLHLGITHLRKGNCIQNSPVNGRCNVGTSNVRYKLIHKRQICTQVSIEELPELPKYFYKISQKGCRRGLVWFLLVVGRVYLPFFHFLPSLRNFGFFLVTSQCFKNKPKVSFELSIFTLKLIPVNSSNVSLAML